MAPNFDELFNQLKSKIIGLYLLGVVDNVLPILVEVRELVSHVVRPEPLATIFAFVIDF